MRVHGVTLNVRRVGSGRPLLLLNGIGCGVETWGALELAMPGFELLSFDPPGVGRSPNTPRPLRMKEVAGLAVALADSCGWDQFDVLGVSWGGMAAQQLAHDHPSRVRRLVLAATTFGPGSYCVDPLVVALMSSPVRHTSRWFGRVVAPYLYGSDVYDYPDAFNTFRDRERPTLRGYYAQAVAATGWTSLPWLRGLRVPTLVMVGSGDRIVPPTVGRVMARLIPGARFHRVEGGHLFLLLQSANSAIVVRKFLADDGSRPAAISTR
ncbi:MAG: poly(3-hydroxyalkanoate) depolymerase [Candidatus Dormibacteria bacterium]